MLRVRSLRRRKKNPFNGIERCTVGTSEDDLLYKYVNPFNGIESYRYISFLRHLISVNPFNGIERS